MCDPTYWGTTLFFAACYVSAALSVVPTVWFIIHGQSAVASLGIWVTIADLVHAINSTVWRKDAIDRSPTWCDISSQIILIYSTGSICSCLCIAKFLAFVLSPSARNLGHDDRRRINIRNYLFSLGFPIAMIPFHYLYSPSRFGLVRTMGCEASYVLTWPSFYFFIIWAPIFGTIAAGYTVYVGYKLYLWKWKNASPTHSTKLPVVRLAWLCITYTIAAVPLSIYYMIETIVRGSYSPFLVKKIRANSSGIEYEAYKLKPTFYDALPLMGSGIYIVFFTFSAELRGVYKRCFWKAFKFLVNAFKRKQIPVKPELKVAIGDHTKIEVDVDSEDEMTERQAQAEPRDLVTRMPIASCPPSSAPQTSRFEDVRFSKTSSDRTLCSSPTALSHLIPR
ncbi:a-factor receptor [Puccinia graminis f. sp. tritici]|uniref:A-factor receptor n=2 Tax=Puccinia graminis f. sp. tritici TaxID=56615 RepID=E3JQA8_PUCGT|nr:uncharacterized protein PGTG_00333 [Puccinia graminis f. sp. tritici CRL 75-36-700-3]EFP74377.2 hypothetical protein PGTG_00333 [Puccinia graminis f. sp. tritici CRL 75-36-700-3]KAA1115205.1 a-factor receptor [Puccinia graminis f. sp. tritici]KAA1127371.1 a-factor receptor [Puccinia graminis f. sp. tritici]